MGTCCQGRLKPVLPPSPLPKSPTKRSKGAKPTLAKSPLSPVLATEQIADITILKPVHTLSSAVLRDLEAAGLYKQRDYGPEELLGHCEVRQFVKAEIGETRLLAVSSYCLYMLTSEKGGVVCVCEILDVMLITIQPDRLSCILHLPTGDVWIKRNGLGDLLMVIEGSFYSKRNKYIPCTTAENSQALGTLFNQRSKENLISYHSPEYQEITRVIIQHGLLGENRLYFRKTRSCTGAYPVLRDVHVLVTSLRIYILGEGYELLGKMLLEEVWEVAVAEDESCQMLTAGAESRLFYLDRSFRRLMEEIILRKGGTVRVKARQEIEGRFRKAYRGNED
jgi:hypothetical protein